MGSEPDPRDQRDASVSWVAASLAAAAMLLVSYLALVLVPNGLLDYLAVRVVPKVRDLIVASWWVVAFVACSWLFVRLQGRARR